MKEHDKQWNKEKEDRHTDNIEHFTGYYHGRFYLEGIGKPQDQNVVLFIHEQKDQSRQEQKGSEPKVG